jgi:hypothetical protein
MRCTPDRRLRRPRHRPGGRRRRRAVDGDRGDAGHRRAVIPHRGRGPGRDGLPRRRVPGRRTPRRPLPRPARRGRRRGSSRRSRDPTRRRRAHLTRAAARRAHRARPVQRRDRRPACAVGPDRRVPPLPGNAQARHHQPLPAANPARRLGDGPPVGSRLGQSVSTSHGSLWNLKYVNFQNGPWCIIPPRYHRIIRKAGPTRARSRGRHASDDGRPSRGHQINLQ